MMYFEVVCHLPSDSEKDQQTKMKTTVYQGFLLLLVYVAVYLWGKRKSWLFDKAIWG